MIRNEDNAPQDLAFREEQRDEHGSLKAALQQTYNILIWRRRTLVTALAGCLAAGLGYLAFMPAHYTAAAVLLTDTKRSPELQDTGRDAPVDSSVVETQIEAIRSQVLALGVVDKLKLAEHPEFSVERSGLGAFVMSFFGLAAAQEPADRGLQRRLALATLVKKLGVRRIGRSYVAEITYTSRDPGIAAHIVNAIAEGYIAEQLGARQSSRQLSNDWMEKKLHDLRDRASRAAEALQTTKASTKQAGDGANAAQQSGRPRPAEMQELEAQAQISKANYEAFLARYTQSLQLQTLAVPATEARLLTLASTPDRRSFPRPSQVLLLALVGGGVLGIGGAFAKEAMERRVRSRSQLQRELGLRALLCVPWVRRRLFARSSEPLPLLAGESEKAVRHVKLAIDESTPQNECAVIGVTSALPREGKSTIAYNVAKACASNGSRVLLVDAHTRRPGLPLSRDPSSTEPELSPAPLSAAPGLRIMNLATLNAPEGEPLQPGNTARSDAVERLKSLSADHDYIILDFPPMLETVEVSAVAEALSGIIVVAEWGRTSLDDIEIALSDSRVVLDRVLGLLINKVPRRSSRYAA